MLPPSSTIQDVSPMNQPEVH